MSNEREKTEQPRPEVYRRASGAPPWHEEDRDEISLVQLLNVLLRHRWKIVGMPVVIAVFTVAVTLLIPPTFTSDASFVPQTGGASGQLSQLSGMASQFGIDVPTGQAGQSPQFYADLLTSRRLLEEAVTSKYGRGARATTAEDSTVRRNVRRGEQGSPDNQGPALLQEAGEDSVASLVELYQVEAPTRAVAVAKTAGRLEEAISVSTNPETGVVELSVTTPWPAVSMQVVERLVELVNRFNNRVRQSQASERARFVAERLDEAERELRAAEDSLETFLQRNVGWQQSPELRFRHDRLQRRVDLKQQVYTSLASRYEEARIDEVRSTPVVTTVTEPKVPSRPDPSRLPLKAVLGLVLGGIMGGVWAFGSEFAKTAREDEGEHYREFVSLKQDATEDVKRAGRQIRRLLGAGPDSER